MTSDLPAFRLKVQQVDQCCLLELAWGQGQFLSAQLPYPVAVMAAYETWLRAYLHFYKTWSPAPVSPPSSNPELRGQVAQTGGLTPRAVDWQAELVQAEAQLLYQFHQWLRQAQLFEIRSTIAQAASAAGSQDSPPAPVEVCLVCTPVALARLPWETWEIGAEFGNSGAIRIARCSANVHGVPGGQRSQHQRLRVLAIVGDQSGLDLDVDCEALQQLAPLAQVEFIGRTPTVTGLALKQQILTALTDQRGWDLLFFAGHSDETDLTGGELAIAPGVTLSIQELVPQLAIAKERGLQLAIFNSCRGLSIASALIDLGLSQVVIMREPIPNRVAQAFLLRFLQHLLAYEDTHTALRSTCQFLKLEHSISLPSAYLVPSLFCHPQASLFRLQPRGVKRWVAPWCPLQREAIALLSLLLLSLWSPAQQLLLDYRLWTQAVYRDLTGQMSTPLTTPPVLLVAIDQESIQRSGMENPQPMDRTYLAQLVKRLAIAKPPVIGIDYLLDRQRPQQDPVLAAAVQQLIATQQTWVVFAALKDDEQGDVGVNPATGIAPPHTSLQAHINALPSHIKLMAPGQDCQHSCPFAYLLAQVATYTQTTPSAKQLQPPVAQSLDLRTQLMAAIASTQDVQDALGWIHRLRFHPMTAGASALGQLWLRPILDLSIAPDWVYDRLPARVLLDSSNPQNRVLDRSYPVVIIAAGSYDGAGITAADDFPLPPALQYWHIRRTPKPPARMQPVDEGSVIPRLTGAEIHAYMVHHLMTRRLVVPIPDTWLVLLTAILGKAAAIRLRQVSWTRQWQLALSLGVLGVTGLYVGLSLQLYISAAVLFPWLLPMMLFWIYVLPMIWRKGHAAN